MFAPSNDDHSSRHMVFVGRDAGKKREHIMYNFCLPTSPRGHHVALADTLIQYLQTKYGYIRMLPIECRDPASI